MIPHNIARLFLAQIETDLRSRGTSFSQLSTEAAENALRTGRVGAGRPRGQIEAEVRRRITIIAEGILNVLANVSLRPYEELESDLVELFDAQVDRMITEWHGYMEGNIRNLDSSRNDQKMRIILRAAAILNSEQNQSSAIHIHDSRIGVLHTGTGNVEGNQITLSQQEFQTVRNALTEITEQLASNSTFNEIDRDAIGRAVIDVETELAAAVPNKKKLAGFFSAVVPKIKDVASLVNAANTLARVFGLLS